MNPTEINDTREELAFDGLVKLLSDDVSKVRSSASAALAHIRTQRSISALLSHYPKGFDTDAKVNMLSALTFGGANEYGLPLGYAALDDANKEISCRAAHVLQYTFHQLGHRVFESIDSQQMFNIVYGISPQDLLIRW